MERFLERLGFLTLASMIGVWGGVFHVRENLHFADAKGSRRAIAMKILSELVSTIQRQGGFTITKPKRSKNEGVKAQCILGRQSGIDLSVSPQEVENDRSVFLLVGFGYVGKNDDAAVEVNVCDTWGQIQRVSEQVVADLCSSQIVWLSAEELDARAHQRLVQK